MTRFTLPRSLTIRGRPQRASAVSDTTPRLGRFLRPLGALLYLSMAVTPVAARPAPTSLRVAAAADLAKALPLIAARFEKRSGVRITCIFGSTGLLAKQAERGAPFDLFLSADERHLVDLEKAGTLVPGSRRLYAIGKLVAWVRPGARVPKQLRDLSGPGFRRIAIANPAHAPYGAAAVEALRKAGTWASVEPKLVYGENVQQALRYAETGAADAALVSYALVADSRAAVLVVPQALYTPIRQAVGVLRSTADVRQATEFAACVTGPEGRAILQRYGFTLPPQKAR